MPWTNDQTWALVNKPQPEEIRLVDLVNKPDPEEIYHHGIKGQKWGVRRYQNSDGSLTPEGRERYSVEEQSEDDDWGSAKYYTVKGKGNNKDVDSMAKEVKTKYGKKEYSYVDGDYDKADELYDRAGTSAMEAYNKHKDVKEAMSILIEMLDDVPFEFAITDEKWKDGETYAGFSLKIIGDKYIYETQGDEYYTDEQYFYKK